MPRKKLGGMSAHAQRELKHGNSGEGKHGRPSAIDDEKVRETILEYGAMGMPESMISKGLGLTPNYLVNILNRGEASAMAEDYDDKYAQFYREWNAAINDSTFSALERLYTAEDPRYVERWLARVDRAMQFVDKDRVAGRPDININLNAGGRPDAKGALTRAKESRMLEEAQVVDSSAREAPEQEREPARIEGPAPGREPGDVRSRRIDRSL